MGANSRPADRVAVRSCSALSGTKTVFCQILLLTAWARWEKKLRFANKLIELLRNPFFPKPMLLQAAILRWNSPH